MEGFIPIRQVLSDVMDQLALGVEMFGSHGIWLWVLPAFWGIAACLIWNRMQTEEEELDRLYVAKAERNLPRLKELIKRRSTEVLEVQSVDRNAK